MVEQRLKFEYDFLNCLLAETQFRNLGNNFTSVEWCCFRKPLMVHRRNHKLIFKISFHSVSYLFNIILLIAVAGFLSKISYHRIEQNAINEEKAQIWMKNKKLDIEIWQRKHLKLFNAKRFS